MINKFKGILTKEVVVDDQQRNLKIEKMDIGARGLRARENGHQE